MGLKSFRTFREELIKPITVTFGRFQPPTIGHEKLIEAVAKFSKGDPYRIYASQTNDAKRNPLRYEDKVRFMRKMFPKHGRQIMLDKNIKTIFDVAKKAYNDGFTLFRVVVGSDRVNEFKTLLNKYNGKDYNFPHGIEVKSAGGRDPDAEGVTGMSATKMRNAATENNLDAFTKGLPRGFGKAVDLFNAVRHGMGLQESHSFRKHVEISPESKLDSIRCEYLAGRLFNEGDEVTDSNGLIYLITSRGANHVEVIDENKQPKKFFIKDIKPIA